jgi:peptide-methionine (S)-S-oxide reductase
MNEQTRGANKDVVATNSATQKALFGAGCFWGIEGTFRKIPGVVSTAVGYAGGHTERPTYDDICSDATGHAEVVEVEYDPARVTYQELLDVFFEHHDPTTLNRQGPDVGTQYRSAIFFHGPEQERLAREDVAQRNASGEYMRPLVTEVATAPPFWRAEEYHQQYFEKKGYGWACHSGNGRRRKTASSQLIR